VKNATIAEQHEPAKPDARCVVRMDEGLIGFSEYKRFIVLERDDVLPFRVMESLDSPGTGFVVVDPSLIVPGYNELVPERDWETVGLYDRSKRLALVLTTLGRTPQESMAVLQAPILINYEAMTARQVILTDPALPAREHVRKSA
jgi:flagellar assembly factor FliW